MFFFSNERKTQPSRWKGPWPMSVLKPTLQLNVTDRLPGGPQSAEGCEIHHSGPDPKSPAAWGHLRKQSPVTSVGQPVSSSNLLWLFPGDTAFTHWRKQLIVGMLQQKFNCCISQCAPYLSTEGSPCQVLLDSSGGSVFGFLPVLEDWDESISLRITTLRPPLENKQPHLKNLTMPLKEVCQNPVLVFRVGHLPALLHHHPLRIRSPEMWERNTRMFGCGRVCTRGGEKTLLPSCPELPSPEEWSERASTCIKNPRSESQGSTDGLH